MWTGYSSLNRDITVIIRNNRVHEQYDQAIVIRNILNSKNKYYKTQVVFQNTERRTKYDEPEQGKQNYVSTGAKVRYKI